MIIIVPAHDSGMTVDMSGWNSNNKIWNPPAVKVNGPVASIIDGLQRLRGNLLVLNFMESYNIFV